MQKKIEQTHPKLQVRTKFWGLLAPPNPWVLTSFAGTLPVGEVKSLKLRPGHDRSPSGIGFTRYGQLKPQTLCFRNNRSYAVGGLLCICFSFCRCQAANEEARVWEDRTAPCWASSPTLPWTLRLSVQQIQISELTTGAVDFSTSAKSKRSDVVSSVPFQNFIWKSLENSQPNQLNLAPQSRPCRMQHPTTHVE